MSSHRVEALHLRVRARTACGPATERFARAVLAAAMERLEAAAPGRELSVERLALRWRIGERELGDPGCVARCAEAVAAAMEEAAEDAEHSHANGPEAHVAVAADAGWSEREVRSSRSRRAVPSGSGPTVEAPAPGTHVDGYRSEWDASTATSAESTPPERPATTIASAAAGSPVSEEIATPATRDARSTRVDATDGRLGVGSHGAASSLLDQRSTEKSGVDHEPHFERRLDPPVLTKGDRSEPAGLRDDEASIGEGEIRSALGGLFYLLTRVSELRLAELLWQACLPEGSILAHAAAALVGSTGQHDPAPWLFGGVSPDTRIPDVSATQRREIAGTLLGEWLDGLPRRTLARVPDIDLVRISHPAGTLGIAVARPSPFVVFAFPAPSASAFVREAEVLLRAWPINGPVIRATPEIAALWPNRIESIRALRSSPFVPSGTSCEVVSLLGQIIGTTCHLFAARSGTDAVSEAASFVRDELAIDATITRSCDTITVTFPAEEVRMRLRRAGLDADPGWIPWLRRHVHITFRESNERL